MKTFLLDTASILSLALPLIFMISYVIYGNRFRAPAGQALMIMAAGLAVLGAIFTLHHPLGLSTASSTMAAVLQICGGFAVCLGVGWLIALMVRANGRWPWQRPRD